MSSPGSSPHVTSTAIVARPFGILILHTNLSIAEPTRAIPWRGRTDARRKGTWRPGERSRLPPATIAGPSRAKSTSDYSDRQCHARSVWSLDMTARPKLSQPGLWRRDRCCCARLGWMSGGSRDCRKPGGSGIDRCCVAPARRPGDEVARRRPRRWAVCFPVCHREERRVAAPSA